VWKNRLSVWLRSIACQIRATFRIFLRRIAVATTNRVLS
jgi:hypothetical protein